MLLHNSLFHTYPHYDAVGLSTLVQIVNGYKFWTFVRDVDLDSADTRNEYHEAMRAVGNGGVEFDDDLERYVVFAGPGDIL